jgi:outer membrane protein TolC
VSAPTTHTTALSARYTQAFTSGTSFSLTLSAQRRSSTEGNQLFNPSFSPSLNFSVNQQLFSGFGFAVNRRLLRVAETNQEVAREVLRQQVIQTLVQAQNLYLDLVAASERVRTAQQALEVAQQLYNDNRKQAEIGTLAPLDVVAAEAEVASRRRDLILAQTNRQLLELRLKNIMSRHLEAPLDSATIEPTDPLPELEESDTPSFADALAEALRNRPELRQAEGSILNQQVAVEYTRRRLKPTMSVFGVYAVGSRTGGLGTAFEQVFERRFPEYAAGFIFSFSPRNRAAQADNLRSRMELRQAETSLQRTRNQIREEVRNAIIGLTQARAQVVASTKAVGSVLQTLDAEQKKLRAGTSTSYNVIRVQRDLFAARLAAVQARVGYAKAHVELYRSTGTTLEAASIRFDDVLAGHQDSVSP